MTMDDPLTRDARSMTSRLFSVLGVFTGVAPGRGLTLSEIARRAGLPVSTSHRLIGELVRCEALERDGDGRYTIGFRMWEIGMHAASLSGLRSEALPHLGELHTLSGQEARLDVLDGDDTVCVESRGGQRSAGGAMWPRRAPASESAAGRLLLAQDLERPPHDAVARLDGVARLHAHSFTSIAAAIRDRNGVVVAAISVSCLRDDPRERGIEHGVRRAALEISRAMGFGAVARPRAG